jgi:hypothetical protein
MTKFEELSEAITRKRNQTYNFEVDYNDLELEVAGSESSKTPLLSCGDDDIDGSIIDDLFRKPRHKPLMGEFAEKWD